MDFSQNHFELFGLPQSYALDRDKLDAAYRELQNTVHPDRFASQPEAEQRVAMQWATQVNEAYQTLRHPVNRGVYLLRLQGINALDASNTKMAPAFLMQQMEWREAIDEARSGKSTATLDSLTDELRAGHRGGVSVGGDGLRWPPRKKHENGARLPDAADGVARGHRRGAFRQEHGDAG
jgi:molecular chaperone HscB